MHLARVFSVLLTVTALAVSQLVAQSTVTADTLRDIPLDEIAPAAIADAANAPSLPLSDEQHAAVESARQALENGNARAAQAILKELVQSPAGRGDHDVNLLLATASLQLADVETARAAAERAIAVRPRGADAHVLLGSLARKAGRLDEAIAHFRSATLAAERELNNVNVTWAWYQLGQSLDDGGYLRAATEALAMFDRAIWSTHPEHRNADEIGAVLAQHPHGALERRLELLTQLEDVSARLALAAAAIERWPDDGLVVREHARALLSAGRTAEADAVCRTALANTVLESAMVDVALDAALAAGTLAEWIADQSAAWQRGEREELGRLMAEHLRRRGRTNEAIAVSRAVLQGRPGATDLVWQVARMQRDSGNLADALDTLAKRLRAEPAPSHFDQGDVTEWVDTLAASPEFRDTLDAWGKSAPQDFATEFVLGLSMLAFDQQAAELHLAAAIEQEPEFAPAYVARADLLLARRAWTEARAHAEELLTRRPKLAAAHFVLAQALDALDQDEKAEEEFRAATRLERGAVVYRLALAQHYDRRGNYVGAQRYYTEALTLDPGDGNALEGLIESYLRDGKLELARAELDRLAGSDISPNVLRRLRTTFDFIDQPYSDAHLAELRKQHGEFPDDVKTATILATGLVWTQRLDEALRVIVAAREIASTDDDLAMLLRRVHDARLEFGASIEVLEEVLARRPNRREVQQALAMTYLYDFQLEPARRWLQRLLREDPESEQHYRRYLLISHSEFGDLDGAIALVDEWLAENPTDESLFQAKLEALVAADRATDAYDLVKARLDDAPQDSLLRNRAWLLAVDAKRFDDVEPLLRKWLGDAGPDEKAAYTGMLVEGLIRADRPVDALEVARNFDAATWTESIQRRLWLGSCAAAADEFEKSLAEFDALLSERTLNDGSRAGIRRRLIEVLLEASEYDAALDRCRQWQQEAPDDQDRSEEIQQYRLAIYTQAGRDAEALAVMEAMLPRRTTEIGFNNDLGYTWVDAGRNLERAAEMIQYALANDPLNAAYLDSYGWAFYKQGKFEQAHKFLERAARLREGRDGVIFDHLGDAQWRLGAADDATAAWRRARQILSDRDEPLSVHDERLRGKLEAKLAQLDGGDKPAIAPTAAEQEN